MARKAVLLVACIHGESFGLKFEDAKAAWNFLDDVDWRRGSATYRTNAGGLIHIRHSSVDAVRGMGLQRALDAKPLG